MISMRKLRVKMWFNSIYFIPPTKAGMSGEISSLKAKSFTPTGEETRQGTCDSPITGPRR